MDARRARLWWQKWRWYERNTLPWQRARIHWEFARREAFVRWPVQGNVLEALRDGRLEIEGGRSFKDAKLFPGGAREWDWRETGTCHVPGIQPADVAELLERGARVVVLSRGVHKRLRVRRGTMQLLKDKQVPVHVLQTEEAVRLYNQLRQTEPVGGLFHSTC